MSSTLSLMSRFKGLSLAVKQLAKSKRQAAGGAPLPSLVPGDEISAGVTAANREISAINASAPARPATRAAGNGTRFGSMAASGVPRTAQEPARSGSATRAPTRVAPLDGRAEARARTAAVFASEHSTGRERQAADMLQTSMSADEITGLLAKSPKGAAAADPMLAALANTQNPKLGIGYGDDGRSGAADESWDRVWAKARPANGGRR